MQADQQFQFTLQQPGDYVVPVSGWPPDNEGNQISSPWAAGDFHILVNNVFVQSPYKTAAWNALRLNGVGNVPTDEITRNRRITDLYAAMYNAPKDFRWAGIASFVSAAAGSAMADASNGAIAGNLASLFGIDARPLLGKTDQARQILSKAYDLLAEGNFDIYMDIYPTFLAYTDPNGGMAAIQNMQQKGEIGLDLLNAWTTIDAALHANPKDDANLWNGLQQMAKHEQSQVLQPKIFDPNRPFWTSFEQNYGSYVTSNIPGTSTFLTNVPGGDFGSDVDRLKWFNQDLYPHFKTWLLANPGDISTQTLFAGGYH